MLRITALSLLLLATAHLGAAEPPAWVQKGGDPDTYPAARYLTGFGVSSPGGTEAEQRRQAVAGAQEALASSIRTHIASEFTSRVTQRDARMSRFAQNLTRTRAEVSLDGVDASLVWTDGRRKVTYALAVLDKPRTLLLLEDRLARQARACAAAFGRAQAVRDAQSLPAKADLLAARRLRGELEEGLMVRAVLGGPGTAPDAPEAADIDRELRLRNAARPGLDGLVATAALDLGANLPRGIRVLMDRVTYADSPFCGTLSAFLEQALGAELVACGQVKLIDKAAGREAIRLEGLDAGLAASLGSQAVVGGTCFDLGNEVRLALRVTAVGGEELAATSVTVPASLLRAANLKLAPDNYEEARKALELCNAQVRDSRLKVKLALDRGDGGIYRGGEKLFLFLKANLDCYVKVLYHAVDGTNTVVFPNAFHPDGRIRKDQLYQIPPDDPTFRLVVSPPFGVELVKVMASTEPLDTSEAPADLNGMKVLRDDLATVVGRTRGISLQKAQAQYAEDTAIINTITSAN